MIEKILTNVKWHELKKVIPDDQNIIDQMLTSKINEIIDWINDVSALSITDKQVTANLPNIDAGELAFLSKENSELKDEIKRITDILYESKYALEEMLNPSCISHEQEIAQEALDKVNAEIKALTKGGDND